jgi:parallel beta-helix repeat protein
MKRVLVALTFALMLMVSLLCGLSIHAVEADSNATIYIRADGTVGGTDKIQRVGEVYSLTGDISDSIVVERDNIVIDGAGYILTPGNDATVGIDIRDRNNVTIKNLTIRGFIGRCALLLINNDYCTIQNNSFSSNLNGVEMTLQSSFNKIVGNNFENNELGTGALQHRSRLKQHHIRKQHQEQHLWHGYQEFHQHRYSQQQV